MNKFKIGDKYIMTKIEHKDLLVVKQGDLDEPWWNERIIRHATPYEIRTGKRCSHPLNQKRSDGSCGLCKLNVHDKVRV